MVLSSRYTLDAETVGKHELTSSRDTQLKHHSIVSQYGQLSGALKLNGSAARAHFEDILYNQVRGHSERDARHDNFALRIAGVEWEILSRVQQN